MSIRPAMLVLLFVLLALSTGWGVFQGKRATAAVSQAAVLREEVTKLEQQRSEQVARLSRAEMRPAAAGVSATIERTSAADAAPDSSAKGAEQGGGRTPAAGRPSASAAEILMAYPEYQRLAQEFTRASTGLRFGALYRKLGLNADQISAFEKIIFDQSQTYMDTMASARAEGISASDPRLSDLMKPFNEAASARMVEILGEAGALEYGRYNQMTEARTMVEGFAGNLYYTRSPLTGAQAEGLTELIARHTATVQPTSGLVQARRAIAWDRVLSDAGQLLSSEQALTLQALRNRTVSQQALADFSADFIRKQGAAGNGR